MDSINYNEFEDLKQHMLKEAHITHIGPYDCKGLSKSIEKKLNKRVSETTLKRIYGFAKGKVTPSLFTLDAMAQFCGFNGWTDFCDNCKIKFKYF